MVSPIWANLGLGPKKIALFRGHLINFLGLWLALFRGGLKIVGQHYLRAAAPAADPGKEKLAMVSAGFIRVFCELSAWMLYIYIIYIYMHQIVYTCVLN